VLTAILAAMVTKLMPTSAPQAASVSAIVQAPSAVQPHPAGQKSHLDRAMQVPAERVSAGFDWLQTPSPLENLALGRGIDWRKKDRSESGSSGESEADSVAETTRDALVDPEAAQTEASFWMSDLWVQVGPITAGTVESAGSSAAGAAAAGSAAVTVPVLTQVLPVLLGLGFFGLGGAILSAGDAKLPTNQDPVLAKRLSAQTAVVGEAFSFSLDRTSFLDPDGDPLQWSLGPIRDAQGNVVELGWLQFNPVTLELSGTPTALSLEGYSITVRVTDPGLLQATDTFILRVDTNSTLFDGYLKHALIFRDQDSDGVWLHEPIRSIRFVTDASGKVRLDLDSFEYDDRNGDGVFNSESWALTNSVGVAPPVGGVGVLRSAAWENGGTVDGESIRTVDISTGKEFRSSLSAPQGSSVMSPLTTLVTAQLGVDPGASTAAQIAKASSDVVTLLFPSVTGSVDLLNLDPVKELGAGETGASASIALQVQSAGQQVANILQVAVAAARAGGVVNLSSVTSAVTGSLLQSAAGGNLDLGNAESIASTIGAIADLISDPAARQLITQQSLSIAQTIAAVNTNIDQVTQSAVGDIAAGRVVNVAAILIDTTAFQLVAQSTLAARVSAAVGDPSSFSAGGFVINVEDEVERVRDQVQQVLVPSGGNQAPVLTPGIVSGTIQENSPIPLSGSIEFADANQADRPLALVLSRSVSGVAADGSALTLSPEATQALRDGFAISPRSSNSSSGVIDWTYDIGPSAIDFLAQGAVLTLTFTVRIEDLKGGSANQPVVVKIVGENDPPIASEPLSFSATEDTTLSLQRADLLKGFLDPDTASGQLFVSRVVNGTGGTVTLRDGGVDFAPAAHFNGLASFFVYVSDGITEAAPVAALINVSAVEDVPNVLISQLIGDGL
jgi:VCBS repeat-containing protein